MEAVILENGIALICNEDGIALQLPFNRQIHLKYNGLLYILGQFYITRVNKEGESISLTKADIAKYTLLLGG